MLTRGLSGLAIALTSCMLSLAGVGADHASHASVGQVRADSVRDLIVGKWLPSAHRAPAQATTIEFTRNGKVKVAAAGMSFDGTYKFITDKQIEVKIAFNGMAQTVKLDVKISKDELITTEVGRQQTERFKRTK